MGRALNLVAPSALEYFAALVADDDSLPLLEAAIAVAQDDDPAVDPQGVLAQIDTLADRLRRRIPADAAAMHRLRLLNAYFFRELGFAGNVNNYDDRRNSYLPAVLDSRRGIPVTLALIYIELAEQIGLRAQGVSFPGHFLIKLQMPQGEVVIDPFNGRSLSRDALDERLEPFRSQAAAGTDDASLAHFLRPASAREILARLLRNLKAIHRQVDDRARLAAVLQRLVILLPEDWLERRDLALAWSRLGQPQRAIPELSLYLTHCPEASDAAPLRQQLAAWRCLPGDRLPGNRPPGDPLQ